MRLLYILSSIRKTIIPILVFCGLSLNAQNNLPLNSPKQSTSPLIRNTTKTPSGHIRCLTMQVDSVARHNHPHRGSLDAFERWIQPYVDAYKEAVRNGYRAPVLTIPTVFHVITDGTLPTNIAAAQVQAQIDQLNIDFRNLAGSTHPAAADVEVEFCLARLDPSGNVMAEPGINRVTTYGAGSFTDTYVDGTIKPGTIWTPTEYLNVWCASLSGGLLGWAQFPDASGLAGMPTNGGSANTDGVVVGYGTVGSVANPGSAPPYNLGRTLTHEVGHWLGLRHIWGDANCGDDFCGDTPESSGSNFGCPNQTTCDGIQDMVENYMDYTDDGCMNVFTADQKARMRTVLTVSPRRLELPNSTKCIVSDYAVSAVDSTLSVCAPSNAVYTINVSEFGGYADPVLLSLTGLPAGGVATFGATSIIPPGTTTLTISNVGSIATGTYNMTVNATSTSGPQSIPLVLTVAAGVPTVTLVSPANTATGVSTPTSFTWSGAPGEIYDIEIATDAGFTAIVDNASGLTTPSFSSSALSSSTTYYWRVRATNGCGTGLFSSAFSFTTNNCVTYMSSNIPVTISASGTPTITSTLNVPISGSTSDINVVDLSGSHTWINDLTVVLTNPLGTSVTLWDQICNDQNNFDVNFDDAAAPGALPCPPVGGGTYQPQGALSVYNGTDPQGNWTLTITDNVDQDGGSLNTWGLQVCAQTDFSVTVINPIDTVCTTANASYNIDIGALGSFTDPVTLSVSGLPGSSTSNFSVNPVTPTASTVLTVSNLSAVAAGNYDLILTATSTTGPQTDSLLLVVVDVPSAVNLLTPADAATGVNVGVSFTWTAALGTNVSYAIDIATDPGFTSIVDNATGLSTNNYISSVLSAGITYYWRVRALNDCGTGVFSSVFSFTTSNCITIMSGNIPVTISNNSTVTSTLNFTASGVISDVNVLDVNGSHGRVGQLTTVLSSPAATNITLWSNVCGNANDFDLNFDDAAAAGNLPCPPVGGGTYQPVNALAAFNGENAQGTWTLSVTDNSAPTNGTLNTWGIEVCLASCDLAGTITTSDPDCAGQTDGAATITATGGTPGYNYLWDASANNQTTAVATGLSAGTYTATITDAGTCSSIVTTTITEPSILSASVSSTTNVSCFGASDGQLTINANGGTTAYSYDIGSGQQASNTFNGLSANNYSITVTDANACTATVSQSLSQPTALSASINSSNDPLCNGASNGTVSVAASGGNSAYTYNLGGGNQGNGNFNGLPAQAYNVTVTDANGCTATTSTTLNNPSAINTSTNLNNSISCAGGSDGSASVSASGGAGSFSYLWSDGQTSATAIGLSGTLYTVTVTDGNNCQAVDNITLADPAGMSSSASVSSNYNGSDISCNGASDGSATVTVSGGTGTYSYLWSDGQTNPTANNLSANSYTVTITDGSGCTTASTVSLNAPTPLSATASNVVNVSCSGDTDGQFVVNATGGTTAYSYDIGSGSQSNNTFSALAANNYIITISDANGCLATVSQIITQPTVLSANVSGSTDPLCNASSDGTISIAATGGTSTYSYDIGSGSQASATFTGLTAQAYAITVTDANGCIATTSATLNNPSVVTANTSLNNSVSCAGGNDGSATVAANGGSGSFSYLWSDGQTSATAVGLTGSLYSVTVTDGNNCEAVDNITLTDPAGMSSSATVSSNYNGSDISCNGASDGSATVTVSGGTGTYSYLWSDGQTNPTANNLSANSYSVTITDGSGCTTISSVNMTEPTALNLSMSGNDVLCNGNSDGTATAVVNGGTAGYNYLWSNGQNSLNATGLMASLYTVTVTDVNGCTTTDSLTIGEPSLLTVSAVDNGDGTATVNTTGGTVGYQYSWDAAAGGQTTATASGLTNNTYSVTVTDANGCTATTTVVVTITNLQTLTDLSTFKVMPNPNDGIFDIQIQFNSIKDAHIRLTNVLGQQLIEYHAISQGINLPVDLQQQASGVYFVELSYDNRRYTKKVIVTKQ